ncbi:hypothetical protein GCM10027286_00920 [Virgibacillus ainsalahensis]
MCAHIHRTINRNNPDKDGVIQVINTIHNKTLSCAQIIVENRGRRIAVKGIYSQPVGKCRLRDLINTIKFNMAAKHAVTIFNENAI